VTDTLPQGCARRDRQMTQPLALPAPPAVLLQRAGLLAFAIVLLLTGFAGKAGVQVVDGAMAARMFALHLHGVAGEAEYVQATGTPAPFIHPHCHQPLVDRHAQPDPSEVQAASALAGVLHCAESSVLLVTPAAVSMPAGLEADAPASRSLVPLSPPPRS
jgi:hypothetical protein